MSTDVEPTPVTENHCKPRAGIIPEMFLVRASKFHLDELIQLLHPLTRKLVVIAGDYRNATVGVETIQIHGTKRTSFTAKAFEQISIHAQIMRAIARLRNEIDVLFFFLGGVEFAIPLLFARLLRIKCVAIMTNVSNTRRMEPVRVSEARQPPGELTRLRALALLERLTCRSADQLVVYDESLIDQCDLGSFREKVTIAHRHFIDFNTFQMRDDVPQRANVVTYIGRLQEEKGVLNLVKAIPLILDKCDDAQFVLVGDGHLEGQVRRYIEAHGLEHNVTLTSWAPHHELPRYYMAAKLQILPSYNEGLPHVMLEAMACGTPVLATPVGAVAQVIKDKETGFLLYDNSPESIAENVVHALAYPELRQIAVNARTLVENEFRYENVLKRWHDVICNVER